MEFSEALEELKTGRPVRRASWNRKNFLFMFKESGVRADKINPCNISEDVLDHFQNNASGIIRLPAIIGLYSNGILESSWTPSQGDMLEATDWEVAQLK